MQRALRGSALPVQAAGSRLRSQEHAAPGWPGASSAKALQRGGNPISTPFSPPPTRRPHAALAELARGSGRTRLWCSQEKLCSSSGCLSVPPWPPMGHPSSLLRAGKSVWVRTSESVCIPLFGAKGPLPASSGPKRGPATGCGRGSGPFHLRWKDSPTLAPFSASLLGTPLLLPQPPHRGWSRGW